MGKDNSLKTMTDTERQLLAAVRADPADDIVRLAYADFLCDSDDPRDRCRGDYVRKCVQQWPAVLEWMKYPQGYDTGFSPLPEGIGGEFERGFCVGVRCALAMFEAVAAELFLWQPLVAKAEITDYSPHRSRWTQDDRHYWHGERQGMKPDESNLPRHWFARVLAEAKTGKIPACTVGWDGIDSLRTEVGVYGSVVGNSKEAAEAVLSAACVRFGLVAAGWEVADGR